MPARRTVYLCSFVFNVIVVAAILAILAMLQGQGMLALSSEKVIFNSAETLIAIGILALLATFLLVEFFLIGLPNLGFLG